MNNIFNNLTDSLNKEFKKFDLDEDVRLSVSKLDEYDLQINNLVKYNKEDFFTELKDKIVKKIEESQIFETVDKNNIGFINLILNHNFLVNKITNTKNDFINDKKYRIIFDYGGPNIGKPLHVGHMRTLNIGRSLYNIHSFINNKVVSDIHLGDWGMPVAQIISYLEKENMALENVSSNHLEIIYPKASEEYKHNSDFKKRAQEVNKLLNNNDKDMLAVWKIIKSISIKSLEENFKTLDHKFDYWLGESDVNNLIPEMIDTLIKNKKIVEDGGALISAEDVNPKVLITKSDGSYLYITTDLATILYRQKNIPYDKAYYIVDNRQSLHFKQLFDSIKFFKFNDLYHEHIAYGTLNDNEGNPFKTRDGGTKPLSDLFNETCSYIKNINDELNDSTIAQLTNSVLTFSDLITNRKTDYKFDLEKFTNVNGKTGIYVQYSQVRAKKLIDTINNHNKGIEELILNKTDKHLLSKLFLFSYYLEQSALLNEPHHLANYLYEISNLFNQFYENEKLSNITDSSHIASKLYIANLFLTTSHNTMFCLGMLPVDEM
ncbi:MAG: arginine--tRNA ligase [Gammaproteobacteria bacterium]|tara:strand:- start:1522 stop:3162 length:1641 start_codon:yes stop_codon:yes gene_type:complete